MVRQGGFTLLEVLLVVAIMGVLAGLSVPVYASFVGRNDLDISTQSTVLAVRRAETYARAVRGDSTWGVRFQTSGVTLFKGTSYASRDTNFDESVSVPADVAVSGLSEVVFSKLSGSPSATGSVVFTSTNDTRTVTLNAKGMVSY